MATLGQKVGTDRCAKCRRQFMPGDRVCMVNIVQKVGKNPDSKRFDIGAYLSEDFELAHITCADPGLEAKIITP